MNRNAIAAYIAKATADCDADVLAAAEAIGARAKNKAAATKS